MASDDLTGESAGATATVRRSSSASVPGRPAAGTRTPPRAQVALGGFMVAALALGTDAAVRVHRMRAHRAGVTPLVHELDLPGRFPPRWLVVLGDSAAAGYDLPDPEAAIGRLVGRGLQASDGRATAVRSVAVDGARTVDVLTSQIEAAEGADVVLIGVGVNDALRPGTRIGELAALTDEVLAAVRARAADGAQVAMLTCPDLSAAPGLPPALRPLVGLRCRAVARAQAEVAGRHGVMIVAATKPLLAPEVFGRDGFHPGPVGHALLAERTVDLLTTG